MPTQQVLSVRKVNHLGREVVLPEACPVGQGKVEQGLKASMRAASDFSLLVRRHVEGQSDPAAWLREAVDASRPLLRPWAMELVFLIGALGDTRFGDLEKGLGISSKVLAARLRDLVEAGHVERAVEDTTPVRITYRLTRVGLATAALATPLFTHLSLAALDAAD